MSGGVMHSIKGKLYSGQKHVDPEYDTAHAHFTTLHDSLVKLKASAQNYSNSLYSSLFNSNTASIEFASILEDPLTESGYEVISKQMQLAHSQLNSDRQSALTSRMSESVLVPLDKLILSQLELNTKVTRRNELHSNLEYYLGKVSELVKERDERGSKGKTESTSQRDKLTRNQSKLDTVRAEYAAYAQPLTSELVSVWQTRAVALGPILAAFASVEKEFVQVYGAAIEQVHPEQIGAAPVTAASLSRRTSPITTSAAVANPFAAGSSAIPATASSSTLAPAALQTDTQHVRSTSNGSSVFGEINEPLSSTHASTSGNGAQQQTAILSIPVTVAGGSVGSIGGGNPFEQSSIPAGSGASYGASGVEGVNTNPIITQSSVNSSVNAVPIVDSSSMGSTHNTSLSSTGSSLDLLTKREDESKQQRYQEEQKAATLI